MGIEEGTGERTAVGESRSEAAIAAVRRRRVAATVVGTALLALVVRLAALGGRVFHWDEGRVGYWILRYHETGEFAYRPIIHGPFLPIVNDYVFAVLPPTDFSARLVVAVAGALLPLAALLFRAHLRDAEVVALALLLAANPILVYYSRFMRNTVLVATFSVFALGFVVRGIDRGDVRYVHPAAVATALAFTTKANALLYLLSFLGAAALLYDHRLVRAAADGRSAPAVLRAHGLWLRDRLRAWGGTAARGAARALGHAAVAAALFVAVIVFFYAPRPEFWAALGDPGALAGVVRTATLGSAERLSDLWFGGSLQEHDYVPYLLDYLHTLLYGAPVVLAAAVVGFLADGYGDGGSRPLVAFATYWGIAAVVGYPAATDIQAPWAAAHAVVALAVPAAVGIAFVYRAGRESLAVDDRPGVALAALVLLAAAGGAMALNATYWNSTDADDRQMIQWAQPHNDLKDSLERIDPVIEDNEGTDVLFYGTTVPGGDEVLLHVDDENSTRAAPPGGPAWHSRLPLPWYLERAGASVTSTAPGTDPAAAAEDAPPVVIAYDWDREALEPHLDGYVARQHGFRLWNDRVVVFVDREALREAEDGSAGSGAG